MIRPSPHHRSWFAPLSAGLTRAARAVTALGLGAALLASGHPPAAQAAPATPLPLPLLIFAGQSNMTGWITNIADLTPEQQQTQPGVLFYGPNETGHTWANLTPPTVYTNGLTLQNSSFHNGFGPEISTGQVLTGLPGFGLVAEVKYTEVGTDLDYWWKPGNDTYNRMLTRVAAARTALAAAYPDRTVYVAGFFWMQGEQDAFNVNDAALRYQANLTALVAAVRAEFGDPNLPFVIGQITDGHHETGIVRAAQAYVAAHVAHVALVDTDDLPRDVQDGIHFTSAGIYTLGERFGVAFAQLAILTHKVYLPQTTR